MSHYNDEGRVITSKRRIETRSMTLYAYKSNDATLPVVQLVSFNK
jgi:hypothetical protein